LSACAVQGEGDLPEEVASSTYASEMCASTCDLPRAEDWETRNPRTPLWPTTVRNVVIVTQLFREGGFRAWGIDTDLDKVVFIIDGDEPNLDDLMAKNVNDLAAIGNETGQEITWGIQGTAPRVPPPPPTDPIGVPDPVVRAILGSASSNILHGKHVADVALAQ
jgi:hypothetical protein